MKFFNFLGRFLDSLPRWVLAAVAACFLAVIGALDYVTGTEIGFSIFYVIPVMLVAWYLGRAAGVITSLIAAATWYAADVAAGHVYSSPAIPVWNAAVRLGFFLLISLLASTIKVILAQEQDLARTDPLTGVLNSRQFYELAGVELDRAKRYGRPFSVAYMDLDNFKEVNDVYGHSTGDDLLCFVAGTMRDNTRASDVVARLGGDEFVILLPESKDGDAGKVMERLRSLIMEGMPEYGFPVTLSVGLITYIRPPDSVEDMIHEVDTLMYYVKNSTRNAVRHEIVEGEADRERIAKLRPGADSGYGAGGAL